jgi:ABC-type multidrug transport system ATPase subunit
MIAKGRIVADGQMDEVRMRAGGGIRYRVELSAPGTAPEALATAVGALPPVDQVRPQGEVDGFRVLELRAADDPRTAVAALATEQGWGVRAMEKVVPRLEEAFLSITGTEA